MSKSTSPAEHAGQTNNTTETADLAFLLRAMHANLSLFDRLQPDQLMAAVKDANRQI
ncbi:HNH endonuclease, partial [Amycolatopsis echigonensis]|nr:HNH endonuclease [Amycolatopsis echigonensis]